MTCVREAGDRDSEYVFTPIAFGERFAVASLENRSALSAPGLAQRSCTAHLRARTGVRASAERVFLRRLAPMDRCLPLLVGCAVTAIFPPRARMSGQKSRSLVWCVSISGEIP
jgi:hypothetical protein